MEKQKNKKINLEDYILVPKSIDFGDMKPPKGMEGWDEKNLPKIEYIKLVSKLSILSLHIANQLNIGPEVKDDIPKRTITLKALVKMLVNNTFLDGYHKAGVLTELAQEYYFINKLTKEKDMTKTKIDEDKKGYIS